MGSLCHPWLTTSNLFCRFPVLKLPSPPCAVLLVYFDCSVIRFAWLHENNYCIIHSICYTSRLGIGQSLLWMRNLRKPMRMVTGPNPCVLSFGNNVGFDSTCAASNHWGFNWIMLADMGMLQKMVDHREFDISHRKYSTTWYDPTRAYNRWVFNNKRWQELPWCLNQPCHSLFGQNYLAILSDLFDFGMSYQKGLLSEAIGTSFSIPKPT